MNEPLISVVIPTFRRQELVQRAVQSVLRQTYTSLEVIVVIDGVDDGTRARIDHLGDARTRVLETGRNQGPAEARNHGVRHAAVTTWRCSMTMTNGPNRSWNVKFIYSNGLV